ncbi:MAG: polysaccharide deacetylase family protein [Oscillospiraceae bacterium]|nr:polysaccharide deacetylase family protein [Oscillospiraceae bacterium]
MFVYTVTKKRALRLAILFIAIIVGVIIGIAAILTSISTSADEKRLPIYHVGRDDNKISLTFNSAWGNSNIDEILAILAEENIRATFFVTGEFVDKYPEDILKKYQAGHEIQSHSDKHPHVEGANINDLIHDTREASRKITEITGTAPTLYRAPYGEYDDNSIMTIKGMGYKYIQWSVDSVDWQGPSPETIVRRVLSGTQSGSIILFHTDLENTTEALPEVISGLKDKGFDFVPVSELIHWENYIIDHSGKQVLNVEAQVHVAGTQINAVFETLLENLSLEEIMSLENGLNPQLAVRLSTVLSTEQIRMISTLNDDELTAAWGMLIEAKVTQGRIPPFEMNEDAIAVSGNYSGDYGVPYGKAPPPPPPAPESDESAPENEVENETSNETPVDNNNENDSESTNEVESASTEATTANNDDDDSQPPLLDQDKG